METSNSSTGAEWSGLPLFAGDTPASLSAKQVIAKVKKILATCGLGYDKPLASYDPTTQFWRMSEGIFPSGEQPSLPILPPSGMTRNGALFQQPPWEPLTGATASSLWPTPTATDSKQNGSPSALRRKSPKLGAIVHLWPTPTADDASNVNPKPNRFRGLVAAVNESMWPTPLAQGAGGSGHYNKVEKLYSEGLVTYEEKMALQAGRGGKLNPMWVEWLMGFPPGWTDLEA